MVRRYTMAEETGNNSSGLNNSILIMYQTSGEYSAELVSAVQGAAERTGYEVSVLDSLNSAELQLRQVEAAHDSGKRAIIIQLVDPNAAPDILKAAQDMKVVFINREPADMSILNQNAIYVGSDETIAGKLQGEWLADYFKRRGMNSIGYVLLEGIPGLPNTIKRTEAVLQTLKNEGIQATAAAPPIVANFSREQALLGMYNLLLNNPNIRFDAIISNNDEMALGAIQALEYLGMDPSQIPIVGVDAIYQAFVALQDGKMAMTVFQDAKAQGATAFTALMNMLAGRPINEGTGYSVSPDNPYVILIPFEPVTANNVPDDLEYTVPAGRIGRRRRRPF